jgi:hypothetical protein
LRKNLLEIYQSAMLNKQNSIDVGNGRHLKSFWRYYEEGQNKELL